MPTKSGAVRLFRLFGITVFLHWSWFVVAIYEVQQRKGEYSSVAWNVAEYLTLFVIVTLHEFGHALACRSVGGKADTIVLWPLGGVAYATPPPRPGATLWTIAAGPLVNVALLFVTFPAVFLVRGGPPDLVHFMVTVAKINLVLLVFNLIPVYPLDGGQILQSLLWFVIGRAASLTVSAVIGLIGAGLGILWALSAQSWWLGAIAVFIGLQAWLGFARAKSVREKALAPRHAGVACPACHAAPPIGPFWRCGCGQSFDPFDNAAICPRCAGQHRVTACTECGRRSPLAAWQLAMPPSPVVPLAEPRGT